MELNEDDYGDFQIHQNEFEDYDGDYEGIYPNEEMDFEKEHDVGYFETEELSSVQAEMINDEKQKSGLRMSSNSFVPKASTSSKSIEEYEISGVEETNSALKSQGIFKPGLKTKVEPYKPSSTTQSIPNIPNPQIIQNYSSKEISNNSYMPNQQFTHNSYTMAQMQQPMYENQMYSGAFTGMQTDNFHDQRQYDQNSFSQGNNFQYGANKYQGQKRDGKRFTFLKVNVLVDLDTLFSFDTFYDKAKHTEYLIKIDAKKQEIMHNINLKRELTNNTQINGSK